MSYSVKEIFYTLQGEGANTGRAAVFCRFAGCNLWTGREDDRHKAICRFCDTDFIGTDGEGGGRFATAEDLARKVFETWEPKENKKDRPLVICTGGEPLLQLDKELVEKFHEFGFEIAVETNGTKAAPKGIDWICVSPKANAELVLRSGNELKLVYPQAENSPEEFEHLDFEHFFLQPMDNENRQENTLLAVEYCKRNPRWKLSLQTHKIIGIP
jgi:7-carboxy-7-deazaguanine synthase (Cx14CxxC type)